MKLLDIAFNDMTRSMRSLFALVFMLGIPMLVTGMFYFMIGKSAQQGTFDLPRVKVVVANLDEGRPKLHLNGKNVPGNFKADSLGEFVVEVLGSKDLEDLVELSLAADAEAARTAVDQQQAQVAVIIPTDFSHQFADIHQQAVIEFYQDPTLTIGPGIIKSILRQFTDGMAGVNITADIAVDQAETLGYEQVQGVIQQYLESYLEQDNDLSASMLDILSPHPTPQKSSSPVMNIVGPIMGGMMVFYAFYTATTSAESILREEEGGTLQRLFTTPTPPTTILSGKFLAVFLTVLVQVVVLLSAGRLVFQIEWGMFISVALTVIGIVFSASAFGIFVNSFLKDTKQGGVIFGGVLSLTGMLGMISIFTGNSPSAGPMTKTASLFVPQGWAVQGILQAMKGAPAADVLTTTGVLLVWSFIFFAIGVGRFNRRYL
jgi:ABC-2 type transport system permease protein